MQTGICCFHCQPVMRHTMQRRVQQPGGGVQPCPLAPRLYTRPRTRCASGRDFQPYPVVRWAARKAVAGWFTAERACADQDLTGSQFPAISTTPSLLPTALQVECSLYFACLLLQTKDKPATVADILRDAKNRVGAAGGSTYSCHDYSRGHGSCSRTSRQVSQTA